MDRSAQRTLGQLLSALCLLGFTATTSPAPALEMTPARLNRNNTPLGYTVNGPPYLAGQVLEDPLKTITCNGVRVGDLQVRVVKRDAGEKRDFYFRIIVDAASPYKVTQIRAFGFNSARWNDVDYRTDGLGTQPPFYVGLWTGVTPNYVDYYFLPGVGPGESSYFLSALTDATEHTNTGTITVSAQPVSGSGPAQCNLIQNTFYPTY